MLRECVECFGTIMAKSPVKIFYHGISKEMIFQSTQFRIFGPLSTTAGLCLHLHVSVFVSFIIYYYLQQISRLHMEHLQRLRVLLLIFGIVNLEFISLIAPFLVITLMKMKDFSLVVYSNLASFPFII